MKQQNRYIKEIFLNSICMDCRYVYFCGDIKSGIIWCSDYEEES